MLNFLNCNGNEFTSAKYPLYFPFLFETKVDG